MTERAVAVASLKADPAWLALVSQAISERAGLGEAFTSDDVWDRVDELLAGRADIDVPKDRQAAGTLFRTLSRQGVIVDTMTVVRSDRPVTHGKKLTVWRGAAQ